MKLKIKSQEESLTKIISMGVHAGLPERECSEQSL